MYLPGDVVSRRKGIVMHRGMVLDDGYILHNTPFRGEHVSTPENFHKNKRVYPETLSAAQRRLNLQRLHEGRELSRYNLFTNNCEHTVTRATRGQASSPQLRGVLTGLVVGALGFALTRSPTVAVAGFVLGKKFFSGSKRF